MAATNPLLNALRIPRQVIIYDQRAKLKVDSLGGGFRGDHDYRLIPEIVDQGGAHVGGLRTRDLVGPFVFLNPLAVNLF
jgi:hypothetical protein